MQSHQWGGIRYLMIIFIYMYNGRNIIIKINIGELHSINIFILRFQTFFQYAHLEKVKGAVVDATNEQMAQYKKFVDSLTKLIMVRVDHKSR